MSVRYRGRIPIVDQDHPESWGKDDITGLPVMHPDMVKQMEYIGNGLAWTGMMVHYKDYDQPNPQLMPPRLKPDPVPILNPRYLNFPELPGIPTGLTITGTTSNSVSLTWNFVANVQAYVVAWASTYNQGETRSIVPTNYTINNLSPGNTYLLYVASTANDATAEDSQFSTSAFSDPLSTTLPLS